MITIKKVLYDSLLVFSLVSMTFWSFKDKSVIYLIMISILKRFME